MHELRIRLLDSVFAVRTDDPRWVELLTLLWGPALTEEAETGGGVEVAAEGAGWRSELFGEHSFTDPDPWKHADLARYWFVERAVDSSPDVHFHAAVLERGGAALLLAGPSGTGKTTLTLSLLQAGWRLVSDDAAPIDGEGDVRPVLKPPGLKDPGLWARFGHLWDDVAWLEPPLAAFLLPLARLPLWPGDRIRPRHLVFPRYDAGVAPTAERLSPAEALAEASRYVRVLDERALAALRRITAGGATRLSYGTTEDALTLLEGALGP